MVQKLSAQNKGQTFVGLTGIFGSGKSSVAAIFKKLGAHVIDSDLLAHEALRKQAPTFKTIKALFPDVALNAEGFDRKSLGAIVFKNARLRKELEKIIHPYVLKRIQEEGAKSAHSLIVAEVPLLYEAGFKDYFDYVLVVSAPEELMMERLKQKGFSESEIRARWKAQDGLESKRKKADFVLNNSKTLNETTPEVKKIYTGLKGDK